MAIKYIFVPELNEIGLFSHYSFFQNKNMYIWNQTRFIC